MTNLTTETRRTQRKNTSYLGGEKQPEIDNSKDIYKYAARLIVVEKKSIVAVRKKLVNSGLDEENAQFIVNNLDEEINALIRKRATKDIVFGSMWLCGGLIGTFADIGFIFWGAIAFGAVQLIKGIISLGNKF